MKVKNAVIIVILIISYGFVFSGCANLIVSGQGTIAPENTRFALPKAGKHKALLWKGKQLSLKLQGRWNSTLLPLYHRIHIFLPLVIMDS